MSLVESSLPRILRIPRSDEANNFALLHVSRVGSADLNLAATEGQFPYTGVVRRAYLETYRSKNYQGSDDDWTHIMLYTLGQLQDSTEKSTLLSGIEASANITNYDDENKLVISIRRRIQTITQRLGSITLRQDNEQVIELFDWTALAVTRTDILEQRLSTLQQDYRMAEDTINRLSNKLNELIDAKSRHEEQLMTNLTQLLNEKKLKIRNQQRLLITANFNTDEVCESQTAVSSDLHEPVGGEHVKRTASKFKWDETPSDDGFEKLESSHTNLQPGPGEGLFADFASQALEEDICTTDGDISTPVTEDRIEKEGCRLRETYDSIKAKEQAPPPRRKLPFTTTPQPERDTEHGLHKQENFGGNPGSAGEMDDDDEL